MRILAKNGFLLSVILCFLLGLSIAVLPFNKAMAEDETDQFCEDGQITAGSNSYVINDDTLAQSFKPGTTTLTGLGLAIAMSTNTDKNITVTIRESTGGTVATASATGTGELIYWATFGFDNVALDATKEYQIRVTTASTTARWYFSTDSCYVRGTAIVNGTVNNDKDFGFFTQGHGVPPEVAPPTDEEIESSSIAAPTKVTAAYEASTNKIKISWTKSETTDINGYHIFRSTDKTKGFSRISQTDSKTYEYFDTVFEPEKTYYYYVTGYKDLSDGLKSNIAEVKVPKTAAVKKTAAPVITPVKKTTNWWLYILIGLDFLFIGFFILYELKLKKIWAQKKPLYFFKKKKEDQWKKE